MRQPLPTLLFPLLALVGCSAEVPDAVGDDHGHDTVDVWNEPAALAEELATSPTHTADAAFARLSFLHRAPTRADLEVQTSEDGLTWSAWSTGVLSEEASDEEYGVWVSDIEVADGEARHWRIRGTVGEVSELGVVTQTLDELAEEAESAAEDAPEELVISGDPSVAGATEAVTNFRRYRYDLGSVGRSWLYLLRSARSRGWRGTLYGPRTGLRTYAQQASLWNAYQNGTGAPAFPPTGPSRHLIRNVRRVATWYQAVDTNDVPNLIRIARNMGVSLHTPYASEPWHVEASRSFGPPRGWRP